MPGQGQAPGNLHVLLSQEKNGGGDKGTGKSRDCVQRNQDPALLELGEILELGLSNATSLLKSDYIKNEQSLFPTKLMELGLCYMPVSVFP